MRYTEADISDLRGLTLRQPFADLMAYGAKCVETRGKDIGARPGQVVAIHAGLQLYSYQEFPAAWDRLDRYRRDPSRGIARGALVAVGIVAAVVQVLECGNFDDSPNDFETVRGDPGALTRVCAGRWSTEQTCGNWSDGRFLIVFEDLRAIVPVPCRGMLGLWRVPAPARDAVRAQLVA